MHSGCPLFEIKGLSNIFARVSGIISLSLIVYVSELISIAFTVSKFGFVLDHAACNRTTLNCREMYNKYTRLSKKCKVIIRHVTEQST